MKKLIKEKGFTLIELVMIIVILSILAAVAVPKYIDLASDAELASKNAFSATIMSAASIALADYAVNSSTLTDINATVVYSYLKETGGLAHSVTNYTVAINGTTYTWTVTTGANGPILTSP